MAALVKLLGDKLTLHGQDLDVASLATSHKYIGLYFSAHVRLVLRGTPTDRTPRSRRVVKNSGAAHAAASPPNWQSRTRI